MAVGAWRSEDDGRAGGGGAGPPVVVAQCGLDIGGGGLVTRATGQPNTPGSVDLGSERATRCARRSARRRAIRDRRGVASTGAGRGASAIATRTAMGARRDRCDDGGDTAATRATFRGGSVDAGRDAAERAGATVCPISERLCVAGLVGLVLMATARSWSMPFVYDDAEWMRQSGEAWSIATAPWRVARWVSEGRPWGPHELGVGPHLFNGALLWRGARGGGVGGGGGWGAGVGLHLFNGALLWRLARRWLSGIGALWALTLFWLHPLPLQAVFYVTGGREAWLATWVLVALISGLRGGWLGWALGASALIAAVLVKPSALPVVLVVPMAWAITRGVGRLAAVLALCVGSFTSGPWGLTLDGLRIWAASLTGLLRLVIWPDGLAIMHDWRGGGGGAAGAGGGVGLRGVGGRRAE